MFILPLIFVTTQSPFRAWREKFLLDNNWKFHLGNAIDPSKDFNYGTGNMYAKTGSASGPFDPGYNDGNWRTINLPRDWAIELPFVDSTDWAVTSHGSKPLGLEYPKTSIGWYRKELTVPKYEDGRKVELRFDGVFKDATVFYNSVRLGQHLGGYEPFSYDVSALTHYGKPNEITVRVNASQNSGWFYEGAGIYRHVWLICTNPVHIGQYGTDIVAKPVNHRAEVSVTTNVENSGQRSIATRVVTMIASRKANGAVLMAHSAPFRINPGSHHHFDTQLSMVNPILWSLRNPHLYALTTQVEVKVANGWVASDNRTDHFGVRTITFTPNDGFFLNGKRVEIKGACDHQDHAGVGIAVPDSVNAWRIAQLKKYGFNALRTSHNMPTRSVIQACDRLGFLVMDETRAFSTSPGALRDLDSLVKRDRNSPSVIMWSIGNEEGLNPTNEGMRIAQTMMASIHRHDRTRPISMASNQGNAYDGANKVLDLRGWNYIVNGSTDLYHKLHPFQPIFGSEEASTLSTRSEYKNDPVHGFMSAYDVNNPSWGSTAEHWWKYYEPRKYLAGTFVWTGFDYRGEPTPYGWPCISSQFGVLDTCGFPKDNAYYYKAHWMKKPLIHLEPHWTWPGKEGKPILVWVETNCQQVKLFLNGKMIGDQFAKPLSHLEFTVPYAPGSLTAIGYNNGHLVAVDKEVTAGPVAKLVIMPSAKTILADGGNAIVFNIKAEDSHGNFCPTAQNKIHFNLASMDSRIVGVGNGDPSSHEADTFISYPTSLNVAGWKMAPVSNSMTATGDTSSLQNLTWQPVDISGTATEIPNPNTSAVFTSQFSLTSGQIRKFSRIGVGQVDDRGIVFVNGKEIGTTDQWNQGYSWSTRGLFQAGLNTVVIWVHNDGGQGGVGGGVQLSGKATQPVFFRRLFNGLCQAIVRVGVVPGPVIFNATTSAGLESSVTVNLTRDLHPIPRL